MLCRRSVIDRLMPQTGRWPCFCRIMTLMQNVQRAMTGGQRCQYEHLFPTVTINLPPTLTYPLQVTWMPVLRSSWCKSEGVWLRWLTTDSRETALLFQRFSVAVQLFNAAFLADTFPTSESARCTVTFPDMFRSFLNISAFRIRNWVPWTQRNKWITLNLNLMQRPLRINFCLHMAIIAWPLYATKDTILLLRCRMHDVR